MILLVVLFSGINAAIMRLMHKDNAFIRNCQLVIDFGGLFNTDLHKCAHLTRIGVTFYLTQI